MTKLDKAIETLEAAELKFANKKAKRESAFAAAERELARVLSEGGHVVDFDRPEFRAMDRMPAPSEPMPKVTTINLRNSSISNILSIRNFKHLQFLRLDGTEVTDLTPLSKMENLKTIDLSNTNVKAFDPLSRLFGLSALYLRNTKIVDLTPLNSLTGLELLNLRNTAVFDLRPLKKLSGLRTLYLSDTNVTDISPIASLKGLVTLYLSDTGAKDITPVAGLSSLETLSISGSAVSDLLPIIGLNTLKAIDLNFTPVVDLRPLANFNTSAVGSKLHFRGTTATRIDPELERLSVIEDHEKRTKQTVAYLNSLTDWPPTTADPPNDKPAGANYRIHDGRVDLDDATLNGEDADDLHQECRDKAAHLVESFGQTNQFSDVVSAAERYRRLIANPAEKITTRRLWSLGNSLRVKLEAERGNQQAANDALCLPPNAAAALADLVDTHALWSDGFPGMLEVHRAIQDAARDPRDKNEVELAQTITGGLANAESAVTEAAKDVLLDTALASAGSSVAAENAKAATVANAHNVLHSFARGVRDGLRLIGRGGKAVLVGAGGVGRTVIFGDKLVSAIRGLWPQIESLMTHIYGKLPSWLELAKSYLGP